MSYNQRLLGPWRRLTLAAVTIFFIMVPFVTIGGESLFRFDLPGRMLFFFGITLPIEKIHLLWLSFFVFFFIFLLVTLTLGRVWCGWLCPQTVVNDLAEWIARRLGLTVNKGAITGPVAGRLLLFVFFIIFALFMGAVCTWYFISPYEYLALLVAGVLGPWPLGTTCAVAAILLVDLFLLRRIFCLEFCPYGRFQTVLTDRHTLTLAVTPEDDKRCIHCNACVRACPVGIDIRDGFQVECINCARCLDACRLVMNKIGQPGIIRYLFGNAHGRFRDILSPRTVILIILLCAASVALVVSSFSTKELSLKISLLPGAPAQMIKNKKNLHMLEAHMANLGSRALSVALTAYSADKKNLVLSGPTDRILMQPGEKTRISLVLETEPDDKSPITVNTVDQNGTHLAQQTLLFTP